jgi:hypothetical protein
MIRSAGTMHPGHSEVWSGRSYFISGRSTVVSRSVLLIKFNPTHQHATAVHLGIYTFDDFTSSTRTAV